MDKNFYNESSALKLGWTPEWFGCKEFDDDLTEAIAKYQKETGTNPDGLCGPSTYRRIYNDRISHVEDFKPTTKNNKESFIIYNSNYFPIEWGKVKLFFEGDGLKLTKGFKKWEDKRQPKNFVCHWDVCLSSKVCHKVLIDRGLAVQFLIDNDGTIYQTMDMNDAAYHAGSNLWNNNSIGVEISNAYLPKHQSWYVKQGLGERPIVEDAVVHGSTLDPFLGFYPIQLEALKALMKAVNKATGIPFKTPLDKSGNLMTTTSKPCVDGSFEGFISHYHLTKNKIDCAGLDLRTITEELRHGK